MSLQPKPTVGDTSWFVHDRFGMFIHWGLYALAARGEWMRHWERVDSETYDSKYYKHFDPDLYDPGLWADAAANAGMKYFVVTTKHHEGFCLWDTALTDYKSTNTPYGKDLLRPMVDAFRGRGLRTGFYHSLIDWHHRDYVVDKQHPSVYPGHPDIDAANKERDIRRYAEYLHGQTRELLTQFGKVDILWYDFTYEGKTREDWQSEKLVRMIRELQPQIILNDRLDLPGAADIITPEQFQPLEWVTVDGQPVVWEACQTLSGAWGYHRDEESWKSVDMLVQMLIDSVSKGGNLLLNVGPTGRGEIDYRALDRLQGIGEWMKRHGRSIYGCTQAPDEFKAPRDCRLTYNPSTNRLYIHVLAWPFVELPVDFGDRIEYAQLLNDASEVKFEHRPSWQADHSGDSTGGVMLRLPIKKPNVTVPVIEVFLK